MISGVSSGIGLELAQLALNENFEVYGVSLTENNWLSVRQLLGNPSSLHLYTCDVSNYDKVKAFIGTVVEGEGKIDLLINNAGYIDSGYRLEELPNEEFERNIAVNLNSVFYMCKEALPYMKDQEALIINVSSNAGKRAVPKIAAYSAAKFGVVALSQSIAKENLETGPICYCVCPGGTNTPMRQKIFGDADQQQSATFVAEQIFKLLDTDIPSGSDIVVRHSKVAVNLVPGI